MSAARATTDHETIRQWVEERGGHPARVIGTESDDSPGILRIDYPGFSGEGKLEPISWEAFFEAFEENGLSFLFQDEANSRFSKLVSRDTADVEESEAADEDAEYDDIEDDYMMEEEGEEEDEHEQDAEDEGEAAEATR